MELDVGGEVQVVRSAKRRRSASARVLDDGAIQVRVPGHLSSAQEREIVEGLVAKVRAKVLATALATNEELLERANALADRYLDGVRPSEVVWSSRMEHRWASCTRATGRIRVSNRLAGVPAWVLDGVLVHELAHLQEPNHGAAFHELANRYPKQERVSGFLDGMLYSQRRSSRDG